MAQEKPGLALAAVVLGAALLGLAACGDDGTARDGGQAAPTGFPADVPTVSDGECEAPRTDPGRPGFAPQGEPTDGVRVTGVRVIDQDADRVLVTFAISARPVVSAGSGEQWVVIDLAGVRRIPEAAAVRFDTSRARRLPATVCEDSAWVFALELDRPVVGLRHLPSATEVAVEVDLAALPGS